MESNQDIDKLILDNTVTNRVRHQLTPEQSARLMQIIDEIEKEKGSPPVWHQVRKNMYENDYIEFQNTTGMDER